MSDLHVEQAGSGSPVVLLHEGIGDSRMWEPQWGPYSERFHVVRYDMRGFGQSPPAVGTYSLSGDLVELIEGLDLGPVALVEKGATPQWCLWASTSTKNPEYRDVLYVEDLIGPGTVNTMPRETIEAFQDHGEVAVTLEDGIDEAKRVFEQVAEAGVDYDDVTDTLEREGVQKFSDSFAHLLSGIDAKRAVIA